MKKANHRREEEIMLYQMQQKYMFLELGGGNGHESRRGNRRSCREI